MPMEASSLPEVVGESHVSGKPENSSFRDSPRSRQLITDNLNFHFRNTTNESILQLYPFVYFTVKRETVQVEGHT